MLKNNSDAGARNAMRRPTTNVLAFQLHETRIGTLNPHDQLHHSGFAGSIGADNAQDLTGSDIEAQILHRDQAAKSLGQAADLETNWAGHLASFLWRACPSSPSGKNRMTARANAETTKVLSCPRGRNSSLAPIRKTAPNAAPRMVRRPPSTAAMMIWTAMEMSISVPTEAAPI